MQPGRRINLISVVGVKLNTWHPYAVEMRINANILRGKIKKDLLDFVKELSKTG